MGDYNRTSQSCTLEELRPELKNAIRAWAAKHELGDIDRQVLACIETTSEKKRKGLFGSLLGGDADTIHYTGALFTPVWLVWCRYGKKSGAIASGARLREVEVSDYQSDLLPDTGLEVFGFINGSAEKMQAFIGLGSEPAAQAFAQKLKDAVAQPQR